MRLEITDHYYSDGKEFYEYTLYDGPDGIEKVHGYATDLIVAFTKVLEWRERISRDYLDSDEGQGSEGKTD
jgi:hypothetical protein